MRFVRVTAKHFQAIAHIDVEFGRGLNVLYGPNDLGKSTLVDAMRAALLVPTGSSEADRFRPWGSDLTPEVTLTFLDDSNRYWRVRKSFGSASRAELDSSKDGVTFVSEGHGRAVDGRLREILGWGIPAPGGKGAPRGVPRSVLSEILLAGQDEVVAVLGQTIENDTAPSGKERIRAALAALAEDPLFAKVLKYVQGQVDTHFTPTGKRKSGKGSVFARAAAEIKRHSDEVSALRGQVEESKSVDDAVRDLQRQTTTCEIALADARTDLKELGERFDQWQLRKQAHAVWEERRQALGRIDDAAAELGACEKRVVSLEEAARACEAELVASKARIAAVTAELVAAESKVRDLTEGAALQRAASVARLNGERAQLETTALQLDQKVRALETAQRAIQNAAEKKRALEESEATYAAARTAWDAAKNAVAAAEEAQRLGKARILFARWKAAEASVLQSADAITRLAALKEEIANKSAAAEKIEAEALARETDARDRSANVPDDAAIEVLEILQQQLSVAEAALDAGFSIALQGAGRVTVTASVDGKVSLEDENLNGRLVLDADRSATLQLGDLLTVDVIGGAVEKRKAVDALRARWASEAQTVLEAAGLATTTQLREARRTLAQLESGVIAARTEARSLRASCQSAHESLSVWESRAKEYSASVAGAEALRAKLEGFDLDVLAASLGEEPGQRDARAESDAAKADDALNAARQALEARADAHSRAEMSHREATAKRDEAEAALASVVSTLALPGMLGAELAESTRSALQGHMTAATELRQKQAALEARLDSLDADASNETATAVEVVDKTRRNLDALLAADKVLQSRRDTTLGEFHSTRGEAENRRKALAAVDRVAAERDLTESKRKLDAFATVEEVTREDLEAARLREMQAHALYESRHLDLMRAEGALSKVGGVAVQEQLTRQQEALMLAEGRQRALEIDADAWQLLRDTLAAVESEGATHLGRALSGPVSERVVELTRGRYGEVRLNQHLTTEGVSLQSAEADAAVLEALSVGTRDQIATLIRLCVAEQLESAIVLDDHLVHTDPERLGWFRDLLRKAATRIQVIVTTCRAEDYVARSDLPVDAPARELGGGLVRVVDVERCLKRFANAVVSTL